MAKQPHNEHELELALTRFAGSNIAAVECRDVMGIPFEYIMQPIDVKLSYRHHPWCTIRLEVGHNELGDADEIETKDLPQRIKDIFAALNFPEPNSIPLMPIPFQIAQKLHGVSQPGSSRVRDLIDLQLIVENEKVDYAKTCDICHRLFKYRRMNEWPPRVEKGNLWDKIYAVQRGDLPVLPNCDEAVDFVNRLIWKIEQSQGALESDG